MFRQESKFANITTVISEWGMVQSSVTLLNRTKGGEDMLRQKLTMAY